MTCSRCDEPVIEEEFRDNISVAISEQQELCQSCIDFIWPQLEDSDITEMEKTYEHQEAV